MNLTIFCLFCFCDQRASSSNPLHIRLVFLHIFAVRTLMNRFLYLHFDSNGFCFCFYVLNYYTTFFLFLEEQRPKKRTTTFTSHAIWVAFPKWISYIGDKFIHNKKVKEATKMCDVWRNGALFSWFVSTICKLFKLYTHICNRIGLPSMDWIHSNDSEKNRVMMMQNWWIILPAFELAFTFTWLVNCQHSNEVNQNCLCVH